MLILLDHSTPAPLRHALKDHIVVEAVERGWDRLINGVLLDTAETETFGISKICPSARFPLSFSAMRNRLSCVSISMGLLPRSKQPHREAIPALGQKITVWRQAVLEKQFRRFVCDA
jgi:hypothetical protein